MKIELEDKDLNFINSINKEIELNNGNVPDDFPLYIGKVDHTYYINFTCVDIAKANNFIGRLFIHANANDGYLEETLGITFNSLNYCHGDDKVAQLKSMLQRMIDDLGSLQ